MSVTINLHVEHLKDKSKKLKRVGSLTIRTDTPGLESTHVVFEIPEKSILAKELNLLMESALLEKKKYITKENKKRVAKKVKSIV